MVIWPRTYRTTTGTPSRPSRTRTYSRPTYTSKSSRDLMQEFYHKGNDWLSCVFGRTPASSNVQIPYALQADNETPTFGRSL